MILRRLRKIHHNASVPVRPQPLTAATTMQGAGGELPVDWMTNPLYWWVPGNVYDDFGEGSMTNSAACDCSHHNCMTDINCAHVPGNVFDYDLDLCNQHDDPMSSNCSSCSDDDWNAGFSSGGWDDND